MEASDPTEQPQASPALIKLFVIGFFLMVVGVLVLVVAAVLQGNSSVSGGLIIFVGPIPIILGAGPYAFLTIVLAVILTVIGFILFFLLRRQASQAMN